MHQPSAQTLYAKQGGGVSIDPRFRYSDNLGACPCLDPLALGRVMEAICNGHRPTLADRVKRALAQLRKRLAR
jgi:hypothetical protein